MSDKEQCCETPLLELARRIPKDLRAEWEIQWFEDGTPCGHAMSPVGKHVHDLADKIESQAAEIERLRAVVDAAEVMANDPRRATSMASVHNLRAALAALEKNDEA